MTKDLKRLADLVGSLIAKQSFNEDLQNDCMMSSKKDPAKDYKDNRSGKVKIASSETQKSIGRVKE